MGDSSSTVRTVVVGGAAGDGVREAGTNMAELFHELGYHVCASFEYPSLIRGGHNYARVSYSAAPLHSDHRAIDILIAVNAETVLLHKDELLPSALVFVETTYADALKGTGLSLIPLPMAKIAEEVHAPQVARTSVAFGACCYASGLTLLHTKELARSVFANIGADMNATLAERGYLHLRAKGYPQERRAIPGTGLKSGEILDGNRAVARGFLAAGLEAYVGYPMTPSTSTLQFLARAGASRGLIVVHPEDEIAVINMALGMSYAGKRVAIGTANGGFALMQESFALAGVAELPLAILVSMRTGPATGVATHTAQGDLQFTLHAGHGEFPRFVVAPGDVEECFVCAADALNLAWKYQIPAIVLSDKHLSESYRSIVLDETSKGADTGKRTVHTGGTYLRYKLTEDGVSPLAFPGKPSVVVKTTSYEHTEEGEATEDAHIVQAMQEKRFRKYNGLYEDFAWFPTVKTYGDTTSDTVVVFWGSTKGALLEAARLIERPLKLVQVLWMEPFDAERVKRELAGARVIIDVEVNHTAQLAALIREKTSIEITRKVLRYDAQPFTPHELAAELRTLLS